MTEILCIIEPAGGILGPPGYATSVAVTDSRWYLRESYGYSWGGHDNVGRRGEMNLERVNGYNVIGVGDGFQSVTGLGASYDGFRLIAGWKVTVHGALIVRNRWSGDHTGINGKILGEYGPSRTLGGVACVKKGGRYWAYSLTGFGLTECDVTSPLPLSPGQRQMSTSVVGAPGGVGLCSAGDTVAYLTTAGELVTFSPGGAPCITAAGATCVSIEDGNILVGVRDGTSRVALSGTPHAVCLLGGVAYSWITGMDHVQRLYREDREVFVMPYGIGTVVDCHGFGDRLYCATTNLLVVIRIN